MIVHSFLCLFRQNIHCSVSHVVFCVVWYFSWWQVVGSKELCTFTVGLLTYLQYLLGRTPRPLHFHLCRLRLVVASRLRSRPPLYHHDGTALGELRDRPPPTGTAVSTCTAVQALVDQVLQGTLLTGRTTLSCSSTLCAPLPPGRCSPVARSHRTTSG